MGQNDSNSQRFGGMREQGLTTRSVAGAAEQRPHSGKPTCGPGLLQRLVRHGSPPQNRNHGFRPAVPHDTPRPRRSRFPYEATEPPPNRGRRRPHSTNRRERPGRHRFPRRQTAGPRSSRTPIGDRRPVAALLRRPDSSFWRPPLPTTPNGWASFLGDNYMSAAEDRQPVGDRVPNDKAEQSGPP